MLCDGEIFNVRGLEEDDLENWQLKMMYEYVLQGYATEVNDGEEGIYFVCWEEDASEYRYTSHSGITGTLVLCDVRFVNTGVENDAIEDMKSAWDKLKELQES